MDQEQRLELPAAGPRYSHYAFRYPAKFHPPVVRALLERYAPTDGHVLDNFCGSGTTMVEAAVSGRRSTGIDVDPVAVLISTAKTRVYQRRQLEHEAELVAKAVREVERPPSEYERRKFEDINVHEFDELRAAESLWVPEMPNLDHWFRRYVTIDLARILRVLESIDISQDNRILFELALAASIRNVSNADPVPVSGLEVTSHMKAKDAAGRLINPGAQFRSVLHKVVSSVGEFSAAIDANHVPVVLLGDATAAPTDLEPADVVITSPPYHNAVDYYRRHLLEMYWLRLVESHTDRLELLPKYIGRPRVAAKNSIFDLDWQPDGLVAEWFEKINAVNTKRAADFRHYMVSMSLVFRELAGLVREGSPVVMVVGESSWQGEAIPTGKLLEAVAHPRFKLDERLWYPIKNRYMSYTRHNGADIAHEHVLVFR